MQRHPARMLVVAPDDVELEHVGPDPPTWERAVCVHGVQSQPGTLASGRDQLAAVTALRALAANPLVGTEVALDLLAALLEANRAHLPRFFPSA